MKIDRRWAINGDALAFIVSNNKPVRCLRFPDLEWLEPLRVEHGFWNVTLVPISERLQFQSQKSDRFLPYFG
jgi:hypothetical protein